ncbi:hypothetical protein LTR85_007779 [Meristemomyces frigidus]|nr:hypothetical protein LTR85_007779 [Meristemomyces frigidus]
MAQDPGSHALLAVMLKQAGSFEAVESIFQSMADMSHREYGAEVLRKKQIAGLLADAFLEELGGELMAKGVPMYPVDEMADDCGIVGSDQTGHGDTHAEDKSARKQPSSWGPAPSGDFSEDDANLEMLGGQPEAETAFEHAPGALAAADLGDSKAFAPALPPHLQYRSQVQKPASLVSKKPDSYFGRPSQPYWLSGGDGRRFNIGEDGPGQPGAQAENLRASKDTSRRAPQSQQRKDQLGGQAVAKTEAGFAGTASCQRALHLHDADVPHLESAHRKDTTDRDTTRGNGNLMGARSDATPGHDPGTSAMLPGQALHIAYSATESGMHPSRKAFIDAAAAGGADVPSQSSKTLDRGRYLNRLSGSACQPVRTSGPPSEPAVARSFGREPTIQPYGAFAKTSAQDTIETSKTSAKTEPDDSAKPCGLATDIWHSKSRGILEEEEKWVERCVEQAQNAPGSRSNLQLSSTQRSPSLLVLETKDVQPPANDDGSIAKVAGNADITNFASLSTVCASVAHASGLPALPPDVVSILYALSALDDGARSEKTVRPRARQHPAEVPIGMSVEKKKTKGWTLAHRQALGWMQHEVKKLSKFAKQSGNAGSETSAARPPVPLAAERKQAESSRKRKASSMGDSDQKADASPKGQCSEGDTGSLERDRHAASGHPTTAPLNGVVTPSNGHPTLMKYAALAAAPVQPTSPSVGTSANTSRNGETTADGTRLDPAARALISNKRVKVNGADTQEREPSQTAVVDLLWPRGIKVTGSRDQLNSQRLEMMLYALARRIDAYAESCRRVHKDAGTTMPALTLRGRACALDRIDFNPGATDALSVRFWLDSLLKTHPNAEVARVECDKLLRHVAQWNPMLFPELASSDAVKSGPFGSALTAMPEYNHVPLLQNAGKKSLDKIFLAVKQHVQKRAPDSPLLGPPEALAGALAAMHANGEVLNASELMGCSLSSQGLGFRQTLQRRIGPKGLGQKRSSSVEDDVEIEVFRLALMDRAAWPELFASE